MILEICSTFYYFTRISPLNCQPRTESETLTTNYKRFVFLGYIKTKSQNRKIAFNGHLLVIGVQTKTFSILCVIWIFWQKCMLAQPASKEESWIYRWELWEGRKRPAWPHESRLETRLSTSTAMCKEHSSTGDKITSFSWPGISVRLLFELTSDRCNRMLDESDLYLSYQNILNKS